MLVTIVGMIIFDVVHPPAVSTSIAFAFRAGNEANWVIFILAVAIVATLVVIERVGLYLVRRWSAGEPGQLTPPAASRSGR